MSSAAHADDEANAATEITPYREQRPFLGSDRRYFGFVSGVGAGKTFSGIIRTILNMEEWNPGEMGAIVAPTRQMIVNVIIPEMRDLGLFDPPINWDYNSAYSDEPGIHTPNDSRALILSADNQKTIERLRGLNLAWWWIDEDAVVNPRAREILMQRLRAGEYRNGYATTTPKGKNHTYDFFVGDVNATEREHGDATLYEADDRVAVVGVPTDANPHTPDDYHRAMETDLPGEVRAQEVEGQFVEISNGVLTMDMLTMEDASVLEELKGTNWRWHVSADLGVEMNKRRAEQNDTDYWALAVVAEHPRHPVAYLCEVRRRRGQAPSEAAQWINDCIEWVPTRRVKYEKIQAQAWFETHLQDEGLEPVPHTPSASKEDRIIGLSVPFANGQVKLLDWGDVRGKEMDWSDFRTEWAGFPSGKVDQLDAVAQALSDVTFGRRAEEGGLDIYGRDLDE
jgi:hypothetical protein